MPKPNRRGVAMATGVAVLATLPYLNTTSNEFVYDDYAQVVRNDLVRSLSPLPSLSEGSVTHGQVEWYRPLTIYSFALNYAFDGLHPSCTMSPTSSFTPPTASWWRLWFGGSPVRLW